MIEGSGMTSRSPFLCALIGPKKKGAGLSTDALHRKDNADVVALPARLGSALFG